MHSFILFFSNFRSALTEPPDEYEKDSKCGTRGTNRTSDSSESVGDDAIQHKISEANRLINRVQNALKNIQVVKTKGRQGGDVIEEVIKNIKSEAEELITNFQKSSKERDNQRKLSAERVRAAEIPSLFDRPKTRRNESESSPPHDKFKTVPDHEIEELTSSFELLQNKLNTICETTESDYNSTPKVARAKSENSCGCLEDTQREQQNGLPVTREVSQRKYCVDSGVNTDHPLLSSTATQTYQDTRDIGMQLSLSFYQTNQATQAELSRESLKPENVSKASVEILPQKHAREKWTEDSQIICCKIPSCHGYTNGISSKKVDLRAENLGGQAIKPKNKLKNLSIQKLPAIVIPAQHVVVQTLNLGIDSNGTTRNFIENSTNVQYMEFSTSIVESRINSSKAIERPRSVTSRISQSQRPSYMTHNASGKEPAQAFCLPKCDCETEEYFLEHPESLCACEEGSTFISQVLLENQKEGSIKSVTDKNKTISEEEEKNKNPIIEGILSEEDTENPETGALGIKEFEGENFLDSLEIDDSKRSRSSTQKQFKTESIVEEPENTSNNICEELVRETQSNSKKSSDTYIPKTKESSIQKLSVSKIENGLCPGCSERVSSIASESSAVCEDIVEKTQSTNERETDISKVQSSKTLSKSQVDSEYCLGCYERTSSKGSNSSTKNQSKKEHYVEEPKCEETVDEIQASSQILSKRDTDSETKRSNIKKRLKESHGNCTEEFKNTDHIKDPPEFDYVTYCEKMCQECQKHSIGKTLPNGRSYIDKRPSDSSIKESRSKNKKETAEGVNIGPLQTKEDECICKVKELKKAGKIRNSYLELVENLSCACDKACVISESETEIVLSEIINKKSSSNKVIKKLSSSNKKLSEPISEEPIEPPEEENNQTSSECFEKNEDDKESIFDYIGYCQNMCHKQIVKEKMRQKLEQLGKERSSKDIIKKQSSVSKKSESNVKPAEKIAFKQQLSSRIKSDENLELCDEEIDSDKDSKISKNGKGECFVNNEDVETQTSGNRKSSKSRIEQHSSNVEPPDGEELCSEVVEISEKQISIESPSKMSNRQKQGSSACVNEHSENDEKGQSSNEVFKKRSSGTDDISKSNIDNKLLEPIIEGILSEEDTENPEKETLSIKEFEGKNFLDSLETGDSKRSRFSTQKQFKTESIVEEPENASNNICEELLRDTQSNSKKSSDTYIPKTKESSIKKLSVSEIENGLCSGCAERVSSIASKSSALCEDIVQKTQSTNERETDISKLQSSKTLSKSQVDSECCLGCYERTSSKGSRSSTKNQSKMEHCLEESKYTSSDICENTVDEIQASSQILSKRDTDSDVSETKRSSIKKSLRESHGNCTEEFKNTDHVKDPPAFDYVTYCEKMCQECQKHFIVDSIEESRSKNDKETAEGVNIGPLQTKEDECICKVKELKKAGKIRNSYLELVKNLSCACDKVCVISESETEIVLSEIINKKSSSNKVIKKLSSSNKKLSEPISEEPKEPPEEENNQTSSECFEKNEDDKESIFDYIGYCQKMCHKQNVKEKLRQKLEQLGKERSSKDIIKKQSSVSKKSESNVKPAEKIAFKQQLSSKIKSDENLELCDEEMDSDIESKISKNGKEECFGNNKEVETQTSGNRKSSKSTIEQRSSNVEPPDAEQLSSEVVEISEKQILIESPSKMSNRQKQGTSACVNEHSENDEKGQSSNEMIKKRSSGISESNIDNKLLGPRNQSKEDEYLRSGEKEILEKEKVPENKQTKDSAPLDYVSYCQKMCQEHMRIKNLSQNSSKCLEEEVVNKHHSSEIKISERVIKQSESINKKELTPTKKDSCSCRACLLDKPPKLLIQTKNPFLLSQLENISCVCDEASQTVSNSKNKESLEREAKDLKENKTHKELDRKDNEETGVGYTSEPNISLNKEQLDYVSYCQKMCLKSVIEEKLDQKTSKELSKNRFSKEVAKKRSSDNNKQTLRLDITHNKSECSCAHIELANLPDQSSRPLDYVGYCQKICEEAIRQKLSQKSSTRFSQKIIKKKSASYTKHGSFQRPSADNNDSEVDKNLPPEERHSGSENEDFKKEIAVEKIPNKDLFESDPNHTEGEDSVNQTGYQGDVSELELEKPFDLKNKSLVKTISNKISSKPEVISDQEFSENDILTEKPSIPKSYQKFFVAEGYTKLLKKQPKSKNSYLELLENLACVCDEVIKTISESEAENTTKVATPSEKCIDDCNCEPVTIKIEGLIPKKNVDQKNEILDRKSLEDQKKIKIFKKEQHNIHKNKTLYMDEFQEEPDQKEAQYADILEGETISDGRCESEDKVTDNETEVKQQKEVFIEKNRSNETQSNQIYEDVEIRRSILKKNDIEDVYRTLTGKNKTFGDIYENFEVRVPSSLRVPKIIEKTDEKDYSDSEGDEKKYIEEKEPDSIRQTSQRPLAKIEEKSERKKLNKTHVESVTPSKTQVKSSTDKKKSCCQDCNEKSEIRTSSEEPKHKSKCEPVDEHRRFSTDKKTLNKTQERSKLEKSQQLCEENVYNHKGLENNQSTTYNEKQNTSKGPSKLGCKSTCQSEKKLHQDVPKPMPGKNKPTKIKGVQGCNYGQNISSQVNYPGPSKFQDSMEDSDKNLERKNVEITKSKLRFFETDKLSQEEVYRILNKIGEKWSHLSSKAKLIPEGESTQHKQIRKGAPENQIFEKIKSTTRRMTEDLGMTTSDKRCGCPVETRHEDRGKVLKGGQHILNPIDKKSTEVIYENDEENPVSEYIFNMREEAFRRIESSHKEVEAHNTASRPAVSIDKSDLENDERKEMVFQSYLLYDNVNRHDPGKLEGPSTHKIKTIDESFYKTYIDPEGKNKESNFSFARDTTLSPLQRNVGIQTGPSIAAISQEKPSEDKKDMQLEKRSRAKRSREIPIGGNYKRKDRKETPKFGESKEVQSTLDGDTQQTVEELAEAEITSEMNPQSTDKIIHIKGKVASLSKSLSEITLTLSYSASADDSSISEDSKDEIKGKKLSVTNFNEARAKLPAKIKPKDQQAIVKVWKKLKKKFNENGEEADAAEAMAAIIHPLTHKSLVDTSCEDLQDALCKLSASQIQTKDKTVNYCFVSNMPDGERHLTLANNGRYLDEASLFCEDTTLTYKALKNRANTSVKQKQSAEEQQQKADDHKDNGKENESIQPRQQTNQPGPSCAKVKSNQSHKTTKFTTLTTDSSELEALIQNHLMKNNARRRRPYVGRNKRTISRKHLESDPSVKIEERRTYFNNWVTYFVKHQLPPDSSVGSSFKPHTDTDASIQP